MGTYRKSTGFLKTSSRSIDKRSLPGDNAPMCELFVSQMRIAFTKKKKEKKENTDIAACPLNRHQLP